MLATSQILLNQFIYLKGYSEKNNTNKICEATVKLSVQEKWQKVFANTENIDQAMRIRVCHSTP